ncbi:hypothetical protein BU090_09220 [Staphylococcus warneri]|uniref:class I SAM-dependent methyltransferase n=1 Tax=Staphylococcus warneri TaxID=1292 RepID=UPI000D1D5357|nr:class I SAM-dependent methyltransferase [Staphylococcus warneri]PTI59910.1 hypothetical protein BU090_09220 [Staphylococcus warneri]
MFDKYISDSIKKIANTNKITDIYNSKILVDFYNFSSSESDFSNDISFYKNNIKKEEKIIELAAGSGRILSPMLQEGYNILGIEKEQAMIDSQKKISSNTLIQGDILNVEHFKKLYAKVDVFILGATTMSLFTCEEIIAFLQKINKINKNYRIYFDIYDMNSFITKYPKKELNATGTYYYHNFIQNGKVIYNLYHKESETLGYSIKNFYDISQIKHILESCDLDFKVMKEKENYYMLRGTYNAY